MIGVDTARHARWAFADVRGQVAFWRRCVGASVARHATDAHLRADRCVANRSRTRAIRIHCAVVDYDVRGRDSVARTIAIRRVRVGWGTKLRATHLTPDEQYSHVSMWCLLSAPLLIGCDLEQLDPFTLGLLSNDEVLALDQDALGKQAVRVAAIGQVDVFAKDLEDGLKALGFFNRGGDVAKINFNKLGYIGLSDVCHVRDLWRQTDLPDAKDALKLTIQPHGVVLLKMSPVITANPKHK